MRTASQGIPIGHPDPAGPDSVGPAPARPDPSRQDLPDSSAPARDGRGLHALDEATLTLLRQSRRRPARASRAQWLVLAITLLVHALFALFVWREMQVHVPQQVVHLRLDDVLHVDLIAARPPPASAPPPMPSPTSPPPPVPPPRRVPVREPVSKDAIRMELPTPAPPKLYDRKGAPLLPASVRTAPAVAGYVQPTQPPGDTQVMHNTDPIKYKTTRFNQYFAPVNESAGSAIGRHVVETLTKTTDVTVHGVHMQCSILGCVNPPPPPSKKDGDVRLSMPNAPLAQDPHPPPVLPIEQCIKLYRDGKPLPYGCPADTPERAIDAEMHARGGH